MTLIRIESGEASVTMGAYLNVISVLGLELELRDPKVCQKISRFQVPEKIRLADYPQLKRLAWQLKNTTEVYCQTRIKVNIGSEHPSRPIRNSHHAQRR